ncbi:DGQHR domain-containing protein [Clostridium perfringens]|uniref:DGQHR domain-containing protein n=1 Tax=Clostridium perfringens TaxID=1502 RepID=A0AAW9IMZ5_CLOPF|nr:DGQHR domain-containing protein [Clostridium perfringens]EHK2406049.1 DGQHR domain-containing protein [Clostridium perfringens]MDZ5003431.1 DGQHR domain-containing protein [Clostridium perfringens]MDZ5008561.1 DGQHR domain-containing protein [Clostridium perfringens]MDZ5049230.1 DGQHR domain-containing protein [Clostridium perfringens]MDZ5056961.1 DGQHR domain-containing protein [Clostridium perfringens]
MLKIKCIENNTIEKKVYSGFINYKELSEYAFLKPLTVNRVTDESRIKGMKNYIEEGNNYPPIVVAIEEGWNFKYNNFELKVYKNDIKENKKRLVIIDGQHRYLSIKELVKEKNNEEINNRKQAIYILSDLSEGEQRKSFVDINDKMKKVSKVSKTIFQYTQENYITLKTIINLGIISNINIKNDQCTQKYPYKFILEANKIIFSDIQIDDNERYLKILNQYSDKAKIIWSCILNFIEKNTNLNILGNIKCNKDYKSLKTEVFIVGLANSLIKEYDYFSEIIEKEDYIIRENINSFIEKVKYKYNYFKYEDELSKLNIRKKRKRINEILGVTNKDD